LRWAWDLLDWLGAYGSILVWGGSVWATTTVTWVCQREVRWRRWDAPVWGAPAWGVVSVWAAQKLTFRPFPIKPHGKIIGKGRFCLYL